MRTREHIDFHAVEPHQHDIDSRLRNWAKWCNGTGSPATSPMFRMVPPPPRVRGEIAYGSDSVDRMDAQKIAKEVAGLPEKHRHAINWHYVKPVSPQRACRGLGCSMGALYQFVRDGRQMLINRLK